MASKESYTEKRKLEKTIKLLSLGKAEEKWIKQIVETLDEKAKREEQCLENMKDLDEKGLSIKSSARMFEQELLR